MSSLELFPQTVFACAKVRRKQFSEVECYSDFDRD